MVENVLLKFSLRGSSAILASAEKFLRPTLKNFFVSPGRGIEPGIFLFVRLSSPVLPLSNNGSTSGIHACDFCMKTHATATVAGLALATSGNSTQIEPGNAISNGREPKNCLRRVFSSKLGTFAS